MLVDFHSQSVRLITTQAEMRAIDEKRDPISDMELEREQSP